MDIGVLSVRGEDYHPNQRLLQEARQKGFSLGLIDPYRMCPGIEHGSLYLKDLDNQGLPRVILPRQGAQIGNSSLTVLSQFQALGIPVVSPLESILIARNKFLTLQVIGNKGLPVPDTCFVNSRVGYLAGVEKLGGYPLVMKGLSGRQGSEVFLVEGEESGEAILAEKLDPALGLLLQRFIPPQGRRDFRVLIIGGEVAGAMELEAPAGDFRSNFHVSSQARAARPGEAVRETALESARGLGLTLAGVDLILDRSGGLFVIEVNYSPGFKGLEASTGLNIAGRIIDHALSFMR